MPITTYKVVQITGKNQFYTKPKYTHFITSNSWTKGVQAGLNSMCSPIKPLVNLITSNLKPQSVQELKEHRYNEGNHVSRRLIPEVSMRACSIACTSLQNYRY
jgi:hypothetical protein